MLLFLFCAVAVGSIGFLCYTDIRYYQAPDIIVYGALLLLGIVVGICSVVSSYCYVLCSFLSGCLLGGVLFGLKLVANFLERRVGAREASSLNLAGKDAGLKKITFGLGLGDVKVAVLLGVIDGFIKKWKNPQDKLSLPHGGLGISQVFEEVHAFIILTFGGAILWAVVAQGLKYRWPRKAMSYTLRSGWRKSLMTQAPQSNVGKQVHRVKKVPLIPCMTLAMFLIIFSG